MPQVLPFVTEHIKNTDWRYRDAAVMAFGWCYLLLSGVVVIWLLDLSHFICVVHEIDACGDVKILFYHVIH